MVLDVSVYEKNGSLNKNCHILDMLQKQMDWANETAIMLEMGEEKER